MVNNKKAQMKIQQMSFMLLAVFFFFALVGLIMISMKFSNLENSSKDLEEKNALLLITKLADSPEFSCGDAYGNTKTDCIDWDKIMALKENIGDYLSFWGISNIEIKRIYPENKEILCTLSNYPGCDTVKLVDKPSSGYDKSNFVSLCRKEKYNGNVVNVCELAKLIVRYGGENEN